MDSPQGIQRHGYQQLPITRSPMSSSIRLFGDAVLCIDMHDGSQLASGSEDKTFSNDEKPER
jgi:hypothetical protein